MYKFLCGFEFYFLRTPFYILTSHVLGSLPRPLYISSEQLLGKTAAFIVQQPEYAGGTPMTPVMQVL